MPTYLVGILYHEPERWELWQKGIVEDYESSTGLFVDAEAAPQALEWAENIGEALLRFVNNDETLQFGKMGYYCWIEENPANSGWSHCLNFFKRVSAGEMPDFEEMGTKAYLAWSTANPS